MAKRVAMVVECMPKKASPKKNVSCSRVYPEQTLNFDSCFILLMEPNSCTSWALEQVCLTCCQQNLSKYQVVRAVFLRSNSIQAWHSPSWKKYMSWTANKTTWLPGIASNRSIACKHAYSYQSLPIWCCLNPKPWCMGHAWRHPLKDPRYAFKDVYHGVCLVITWNNP